MSIPRVFISYSHDSQEHKNGYLIYQQDLEIQELMQFLTNGNLHQELIFHILWKHN